jgi:hypothetical protein
MDFQYRQIGGFATPRSPTTGEHCGPANLAASRWRRLLHTTLRIELPADALAASLAARGVNGVNGASGASGASAQACTEPACAERSRPVVNERRFTPPASASRR